MMFGWDSLQSIKIVCVLMRVRNLKSFDVQAIENWARRATDNICHKWSGIWMYRWKMIEFMENATNYTIEMSMEWSYPLP